MRHLQRLYLAREANLENFKREIKVSERSLARAPGKEQKASDILLRCFEGSKETFALY
jgi:hypothetical protein